MQDERRSRQPSGLSGIAGAAGPPHAVATLTEMMAAETAARPGHTAVTSQDEELSFAELLDRSTRLAAALSAAGVAPGRIVGIYMEPSVDLVVAVWGVLYTGAAYLPLAPDYPEDRIAYIVSDSGIQTVLTQESLRSRFSEVAVSGCEVIAVDSPGSAFAVNAAAPASQSPTGRDAAYVVYTSGTTGWPKGVVIEHGSIVNQMSWLRDKMRLGPGETVLSKTPMSFDAAQWELLAVACGARVVVGEAGLHRDATGLLETVSRHDVTVLQCVPTLLQALVEDELFGQCRTLRTVFSGGEALSRKLASRFAQILPDTRLINLYGPTECTINATALDVTPAATAQSPAIVPLGRPVAGTSLFVLDEQQRPVPVGEVGELCIAGRQLARGYLKRDDETRSRFLELDLLQDGQLVRVYRTGDLGRLDENGVLHFAGRKDGQVKVRGHRIELDEVRLAIENHDWVKSAAVLVRNDEATNMAALTACVELNPREAALMDQGQHGGHHQSKSSRVQVRAQIAGLGIMPDDDLQDQDVYELPGRVEPAWQRRRAFARKTYRFFEGDQTTRDDIVELLAWRPSSGRSRELVELSHQELGEVLRYFGQFHADERLLPKHAYASPGALYAVQLLVELHAVAGFPSGVYYYHPAHHHLILLAPVSPTAPPAQSRLRLHFIGQRSAIESVYANNVTEVLEFEVGHMVGLLDKVLPDYGLGMGSGQPPGGPAGGRRSQ